MNIQSFLHFWNAYNDSIIEVLLGVVILMVLMMAVRYYFFESNTADSQGANPSSGSVAIDTTQIEKTLQKILETQAHSVNTQKASPSSGEPLNAAGASSAATSAELEKIRFELNEKDKLLAIARAEAAKAAASAAAQAPQGDSKGFESKVKDLEARLAEYEIISEDIADLSFYKEENIRLQNELSALKAGGAVANLAVAPESVVEAPRSPAATEAPKSIANSPAAEPKPAAESAPAVASPPAASPSGADEDLMKEFAKAVEEQKAPPTTAAPAPPKTDVQENSELMNQFENFVKKG